MQLNQRQIDILFAATGALIIIGYVLLFQRPINAKLGGLRSEIKEISLSAGPSTEIMESKLNQLNQIKASLSQEIKLLEARFSRSDPLWDLMQTLSRLAEEAGLAVALVQPEGKPEAGQSQQNSLLIRLSGDFPSFYRFLAKFEKSTPGLKANSLKIEAQPDASQPTQPTETKSRPQTQPDQLQQTEALPPIISQTDSTELSQPAAHDTRPPVAGEKYLEEVRFDLLTLPSSNEVEEGR